MLNAWWKTLDQLDRRELEAVERDIYIRKNALQMTPSLRQTLFVDVVVDADAKPGRRDLCVWTQYGISPPRPLYITAERRVEEPPYAPPHRKRELPPVVSTYPAFLDGRIMPGETDRFDLTLQKGTFLSCDVTARDLQPYVGDAVPGFFNAVVRLFGPDGREVAFADDRDRFRPDPAFTVEIPEDGTYRLEIHDNLFRGREDFVYSMRVDVTASAPPTPAPMQESGGFSLWRPSTWFGPDLDCGGSVRGVIEPGERDVYSVRLKGPGAYIFDLRARRDGSPLDGVLTLTDEEGRVVWRVDDVTNALFVGAIAQAECDAIGRVEIPAGETRRYAVTVEDVTGHGGPEYGYELSLRKEAPGACVYAGRSSIVSRAGTRQPMALHVVRTGGFTGPVTLLESEGFRFETGYVPAGTNEFKAIFVGKTREELPLRTFRIRALLEPDGSPEIVDVVPTDECMQAFAWRHLLPAQSFIVKNLPPVPPKLQNLKPSDTLTLVGSAATPGVVRAFRLCYALRHPFRASNVDGVAELPSLPLAAGRRAILLTPLPYDQYGDQAASNLWLNSTVRTAEAADIRRTASMKFLPMADLHYQLTQVLRERVEMRLCGADRQTPSAELELLAAAMTLETLGIGSEVAHVTLDAVTRKEDLLHARIRDVDMSAKGGGFVYVARALPLPVTDVYRKVDAIYPLTARHNREMLTVKGLDAGTYSLRFDGAEVCRITAMELAKGVNVALLDTPGQRKSQRAAASAGRVNFEPPRPQPVRVTLTRKD